MAEFYPALLLGNAHLQTVAAHLLRRGKGPTLRRERWTTPDGDFIDLDFLDGPPGAPKVLLLHGLEGSSASGYVVACLKLCQAKGWSAVALNFRSCSGEPNLKPRSYCMGDTADPKWVLERLGTQTPRFAIGFSLGANVLLKLLCDEGASAPLDAAVAISAPFDPLACARALDGPGLMMKVYQLRFLRTLEAKALQKAARFPQLLDPDRIRRAKGIIGFDDAVTAPLYGLPSAEAYYAWAATGPRLGAVRRPTLLISSKDDPLAPATHLPRLDNPALHALVTANGGHCGFVGEGLSFFAEAQAFDFLARHA